MSMAWTHPIFPIPMGSIRLVIISILWSAKRMRQALGSAPPVV